MAYSSRKHRVTPEFSRRGVMRRSALAVSLMTASVGVVTFATSTVTSATSSGTTLFSQTFTDNSLSSTGGSLFIPMLPSGSLANAACLTVQGSTANIPSCSGTSDSNGSGALQLTPASGTQEGGVFSTVSVPSTKGLDINFNTYQYNGTGADGIAFVLAAADPTSPQPPSAMGQSGGSLGYSSSSASNGLVNGYLGIGFDVYGNYSNGSYNGSGCGTAPAWISASSTVPGQVVVRGPGTSTTGYCPLYSTATSTSSSPLALHNASATSRSGVTVPVEVIINTTSSSFTSPRSSTTVTPGDFAVVFTPIGGSQTVLGGTLPSDSYVPSSWVGSNGVPKQLIFGWVASTGGSTEIHEVNSVNVVSLNPVPVLQVSQQEYAPTTTSGSPVTYTDNVSVGSSGASESQPVTVTDTLPTGVTPINGGGNGWVCLSPVGQQVNCTYTPTSPLAPGSTLPPLYINGTNTSGLPASSLQANNVTVASSSDANPSYTSTSTQTATPPPLPTTTAVSPTSGPIAGGNVVTLSGTNLNLATTVKIGTASQISGGTATSLNLCPSGSGTPSSCFSLSGQDLTLYMPALAQGTLQVVAEEQGQYSGSTVPYVYTPPISITGSSSAISETTPAGSAYTFTPGSVVGGVGALSWRATGLPSGLLIDPLTGVISGIPTTPGVYTIVSTVTDSANNSNTETLTLTVTGAPNTPKGSVTTGTSAQNYSGSVAVQNAPAGTTYSITTGSLPTGLTLDSANGQVTGNPTTPGKYTFEVTAASPSGGTAVYTYTLTVNGPPNTSHGIAGTATGKGYWTTTSSGQVSGFGDATSYGSTASMKLKLNQPIVGLEANYQGNGYWQVASDGGVFAFGGSNFYGSMANTKLNGPVEGLVPSLDGKGYWLVATDGGVFSFGDATFYGSMANTKLNGQVVGIESTPDGNGYWLVAADGGVFSFGDASFYGSLGATKVASPIVALASTLDGKGYWLVSATGQVFAYGDATSYGSLASSDYVSPISGISVTNDGLGYWLIAQNGGVYAYGDAKYYGGPSGSGTIIP